jgi:branched-chain amino acid transport system permease protein
MVVLGGMGSISGAVLGAALIAGIPQVLQASLGGSLIQHRYLIFGFALIVVIIFRPQGLLPSKRRALELEEEKEAEEVP